MPTGVHIKAFGHISTLLGATDLDVACDGAVPVRSMLSQLARERPSFAAYIGDLHDVDEKLLVVRSGKIQDLDSIVAPGDDVILVTPIGGG